VYDPSRIWNQPHALLSDQCPHFGGDGVLHNGHTHILAPRDPDEVLEPLLTVGEFYPVGHLDVHCYVKRDDQRLRLRRVDAVLI
jgi:hypothetical protein